ncbi:MAG: hypothetical protein R3248_11620 [Candidatus Promineifilaceae bacterium]|nr:hypothetical protein [Candidatus Promineifilaceae bacterium]
MKKWRRLLLVTVLALLLVACQAGGDLKGRKPSPDWSRSRPIGADVRGRIAMAVEGAGEKIHLAWPQAMEDQIGIHYKQLDQRAQTVAEHALPLPEGASRSTRLLLSADNRLHLFWARRVSGETWNLWYAGLNDQGELVRDPVQLSPSGSDVGDYSAIQDPAGNLLVVWGDGNGRQVVGLRIPEGRPPSDPQVLGDGESPSLSVDETGNAHLVWREENQIRYAALPGGDLAPGAGVRVADLTLSFGDAVTGPVLGTAGGWGYVFWSIFSQSGLEAGTGRTEYVTFPLDSPAPSRPERLAFLPDERQSYVAYDGAFPLTQVALPPTLAYLNTDFVGDPDVARGPGGELAVAVAVNQELRQQTTIQLAVMLLADGEPLGYQMAAKTPNLSVEGNLTLDEAEHLHLAWREGAGGLSAYYATTAPEARAVLDRLTTADVANVLLTATAEGMSGLVFLPFAAVWSVPGLLLLGLWKLRRDDEHIDQLGSRIVVTVAIVIYEVIKLLFMPGILSYVPFSAWLDVPPNVRPILLYGTPFFIIAMGVLVAEIVRRRRDETPTIGYYFAVVGVDAALTLLVYGVNFMGVF